MSEPSKAAIWDAEPSMPAFRASKAILADAPPNGWPPLYSMAAHIDAAMAEERAAAEKMAKALRVCREEIKPGTRTQDFRASWELQQAALHCISEALAAYESARGEEAMNG